jgi:hypothetical protein
VPRLLFAFVADLADSRRAPDRSRLARAVAKALRDLASAWPDDWAAPPITTRGLDEISGVLRRPEHAFDALAELNAAIWPQRFRAALAGGSVDVAARTRNAGAMDGPAFHRAADALLRAKRKDLPLVLAVDFLAPEEQRVLEQAMRLHGAVVAAWKPSRAAAVTALRATGTQKAAARRLKVTPQSVSEALAAAHGSEIVALEAAIRERLATAYSQK